MAQLDATAIHVAGICSGAYHSLKGAAAGLALSSIVVINPLTFFWKPGMTLAAPEYQDTGKVLRLRREALSLASLRRLLSGRLHLRNLAVALARYGVRRLRGAARHVGRRLGVPLQDDLVKELRGIRSRGTSMHFVFASTDPGHSMLREHAGGEIGRLQAARALTVHFIEGADHTFTPPPAQQALAAWLEELMLDDVSGLRRPGRSA
jgi:hypothetical protein